jgi:dCMP deaminase
MIIGLTGENCAGKDTVAEYLQKKTFFPISLSDIIREELKAEGKPVTRESLLNKGTELRKKFGPRILAIRSMQKMQPNVNYVVVSIRNPFEVEELRKLPSFSLWYVTAKDDVRFERMKSRGRESDAGTFEEFMKGEQDENKADKLAQQVKEVCKMADITIENNTGFKVLYETADKLLAGLSKDFKADRPTWDQYFMNIAKEVAKRSNCMKRQVAAVIVKDKRIISTGYNGTPRGTTNCNEGGCARCNNYAEGGTKLDECVCSHGEENSIVQASYHGISIKDSSIYTTFSPCLTCTKMIINAGIKEVVYNEAYLLTESAVRLLKESKVILRQVKI